MSIVQKAIDKIRETREVAGSATDIVGNAVTAEFAGVPATLAIPAHSADELTTKPVVVDRAAWAAAGLLAPETFSARSSYECRAIKQDLMRYIASSEKNDARSVVLITSALPGDGKSFVSTNLALSLSSEREYETVLVDGDVAMRHITRSVGLEGRPGLLDMLRDKTCKLSSTLYATSVPRLFILPAGNWADDASDLLGSERLRQVLTALSSGPTKRVLVVDSAPLLLTSDSRVISEHAGQIVLVVKTAGTSQRDVQQAINSLNAQGRRVALVLNQIPPPDILDSLIGHRHSEGYGYGYYPGQSGAGAGR